MKREATKFIGFFNLMEAMKKSGCPACLRILEETHHAMESFLYESVNDPGLRDQIRQDRGLCHRHSWQLAKFGDALGGAILFRDVLKSVLPEIGNHRPGFSFFRRQPAWDVTTKACLFCRSEQQSHDGVVAELAVRIGDVELSAAWEGPAALCLPHLSDVCASVHNDAALNALVELHRTKYLRLCEHMSSLIEKQSYDHRPDEISPEEKHSWMQAIEALVGRPDVH